MKTTLDIFLRFLALGCTSFGGPTAHLGYYHAVLVEKHKWIDEATYTRWIALCQFLPGPGSSQFGFAVGLRRGGLLGACAAFLGFTLPSFLLMLGLATLGASLAEQPIAQGMIAGLKLLAVVVVTHAVLGMARNFWTSGRATAFGVATATVLLWSPSFLAQIAALVIAALLGLLLLRDVPAGTTAQPTDSSDNNQRARPVWLVLFASLLVAALLAPQIPTDPLVDLGLDMVRVGSLVFGGGHVVLPLLQTALDSVSNDQFLTGYAAAQGVPGPMFTLATYLGAMSEPAQPFRAAVVATLAIFLPGFLLVLGLEPVWTRIATRPNFAAGLAGINAAVVGLLLAALIDPVVTSAIATWWHVVGVAIGFWLLHHRRIGIGWLVLAALLLGGLSSL